MAYMSVTPDQMASAGSYISHNWGDYGYRIEGVQTRTYAVTVFRVCASDGSRFTVLADKWGNCRYLDTHSGDDGLSDVVDEMHEKATAR
jgi:hypothetical protein